MIGKIAAVICLLLPLANAQTIHTDSRLVLIDSTVTDRKGEHIRDLTQKDFKVWEDGKEQAISSFSFEADPAAPADGQKHHLILFFDNSTLRPDDQLHAREAAASFIDVNAGPNNLISIVEFNGGLKVVQDFTGDAVRLKQAIGTAKASAPAPIADTRNNQQANRAAASAAGRNMLAALRELATGVARVPGRKAIILMSSGFRADPEELSSLVQTSNRANAVFYSVEFGRGAAGGGVAGGLDSGMDAENGAATGSSRVSKRAAPIGDTTERAAADAMLGLAEGTGGFTLSRTLDLPGSLARIGKEQTGYYSLGYVPSKEADPGACHTIKVKVDRGGTNVRFRSAYCETVNASVLAATPAHRELEARLAANATPVVRAQMQAPFFYIAPNTARVNVAMEIPGDAIKFTKDKGKFQASLNVIGIAYLPDGGVAARFNDNLKFSLEDKKQTDAFAAKTYHYEKQFEVASGKLSLKVAFSSSADSFGSVESPLIVEEWTPAKFFLSGLALSKTYHTPGGAGLAFGPDASEKVPLLVDGVQLIPSGDNHFHKSDQAFIYGEVYDPGLAVLTVHMTLLDAKTKSIVKDFGTGVITMQPLPGGTTVPMGLTVPVASLAGGSYTMQVTVLGAGGGESTRMIDFELEP
jgi:VWFA-related protein